MRAANAPVRLHGVLTPARDAKGQSRNGVNADEVARRTEHTAGPEVRSGFRFRGYDLPGPEVLVLRQVTELHNGLVVEVERHLRLREARARIWREQGKSRGETMSGVCT